MPIYASKSSQRTVEPELSDAEQRLAKVLEREPVTAAWIFGSQAGGTPGPMADVDVALLPSREIASRERLGIIGRVSSEAQKIWGVHRADVIFLDEADSEFASVVINGRLILDRDEQLRIATETGIRVGYASIRGALARHWASVLERYAAGGFAR